MVWPHSSMLLTLPFVSGQGAESSGGGAARAGCSRAFVSLGSGGGWRGMT